MKTVNKMECAHFNTNKTLGNRWIYMMYNVILTRSKQYCLDCAVLKCVEKTITSWCYLSH